MFVWTVCVDIDFNVLLTLVDNLFDDRWWRGSVGVQKAARRLGAAGTGATGTAAPQVAAPQPEERQAEPFFFKIYVARSLWHLERRWLGRRLGHLEV